MSMAMGGTFQDGFIGSAIGAGISHITGGLFQSLQGDGVGKFLVRTAIASIGGGAGSVLAGGKFSDGAFSAAFFHVFNCEGKQVLEVAGEIAHTVYQGLARFGDAMNPFGDPAFEAGVYDETLGGGAFAEIAAVANPVAIGGKLGLGQKVSQGWNKLKAFAWTSKASTTATTATPKLLGWSGKLADHHIFPVQFKKFFQSHGINIDDYTVSVDHLVTHLKAIHGNGNLGQMPGKWNHLWADWISKNPNATAVQVYQHAGRMMNDFGIAHLKIHPYKK